MVLTEQPFYVAKHEGIVELRGVRTVKNRHGQMIVMSRKARLLLCLLMVVNYKSHDLEYGSILLVNDKQPVKSGTRLAEWDPASKVLLTEKAVPVKFVDLVENVTMQERFDEKPINQAYDS